jgi:dolichyl-phosphate beta-glucosyltransferase
LKGQQEYRVISYGANRGKGYALKQGMMASRGQVVLFSDADLATPIEELDKILPWLQTNPERPSGYEIVHGSRKMPGALVEQHQPWLRENMGKVFTWLCNKIVGANVSDATCGFKCYKGEVARIIYARQQLFDWSFDAEIIHIARRNGYNIKEVPVRWHDVRGTKVNLLRDTIRSLTGLFRIRWNGWRGYYDQAVQSETPITIAGK